MALKALGSDYFQEVDSEADLINNLKDGATSLDFLVNNFKQYSITVTGTNSWVTTFATARPFKMNDGSWWVNISLSGSTSAAGGATLTISSLTFLSTGDQSLSCLTSDGGVPAGSARANGGASTITLGADSGASVTSWQVSGTVRLNTVPTFVVQDLSIPQGFTATKWASYTPTYTGFGTVTSDEAFYKRIDDSMWIKGRFTTGTTTATEARISLPTGTTSSTNFIDSTAELVGHFDYATTTDGNTFLLVEPNVSYIVFDFLTGSLTGLSKDNGSSIPSTTDVSWQAGPIPIAEWE